MQPRNTDPDVPEPDATTERTPRGSLPRPSMSPSSFAPDRFVFERVLGTGAYGTVHKVYDKTLETSIAVKYLTNLDPTALYRFKAEFRALVNFAHPNLVQHHELLAHDGEWLLTMEFVEGPDFLTFVRDPAKYRRGEDLDGATSFISLPPDARSGEPPPASTPERRRLRSATALDEVDEQRLRHAFRQLAEGLEALHREGRLHRDVKPDNVLVNVADQRVVICDFGLALEAATGTQKFDPEELAGTRAFLSPEHAQGLNLTPASDWYGAGVMLYQALTGLWPIIPARDHQLVVQQKLHERPQVPADIAPGTSEALSALALALLHPDPEARAGYHDVVRVLDGTSTVEPGSQPNRALIGRAPQLAALRAAFDATRRGSPALALVSGRSGVGKSSLVAHFLNELEDTESALVLRARCYEREELPYKALDPLIDALGARLMRLDAEQVAALLPPSIGFLADLFPALGRVPAIAALEGREVVNDPGERRRRAFQAFRELCRNFTQRRPLVLFIDDLQWSDIDSAPVLQDLLAPPNAPPLLIVCSYREGLLDRIPLLGLLRDEHTLDLKALHLAEVPLGPLAPPDAEALAQLLLGGLERTHDELAARIAKESEGSPFYIHELASYVRAHGSDAAPHARLDALLELQVSRLPPECRTLLSIVAVAGYPLRRDVLRDASRLGPKVLGALRRLEVQKLVAIDRTGDEVRVECAHDRIRETAFHMLESAQTRRIHRALGLTLERAASDDIDALLEHFRGAGDREKVRAYALRGAEKAEQALAFARAAELYQEALSLSAADEPDVRLLREQLGMMLSFAGRGTEAAHVFLALVQGATHAEALHFRMLAATQFLRGGQLLEGFDELERADKLFGVRFPRSDVAALAMLGARKVRISLTEHRLKLLPEARETPSRSARLDALWEVAAAVACADFVRGNVYSAELSLRTMRTCDPRHVAGACGLEAIASAAADEPERTDRMLALAEAAARCSGHLHILGRTIGMKAVCRQLEGNWRIAVTLARESQELQLRSAHHGWDHAIMVWWEMMAASPAGYLQDMAVRVPEALRAAEARGDVYAATGFRTHRCSWAWLAKDRSEAAEFQVATAERAWKPTGYQFQHWHMTYARAEIGLYRGDPTQAFERVMSEWRRTRLVRLVQNVRIDMLYARARLALAQALVEARPALYRQAAGDGRALLGERRPWALALGTLVLACAASFDDRRETLRLFSDAARRCEAADMPLHGAAARVRRGELMGGAEGSALVDEGLRAIAALGATRPEAFVRLLAPVALRSR